VELAVAELIPPLLYAGLFGTMLTAMQLGTFCLTVIALDLGQRTHEVGWQVAEYRLLLTIGGLALARVFSLRLPQTPTAVLAIDRDVREKCHQCRDCARSRFHHGQ